MLAALRANRVASDDGESLEPGESGEVLGAVLAHFSDMDLCVMLELCIHLHVKQPQVNFLYQFEGKYPAARPMQEKPP